LDQLLHGLRGLLDNADEGCLPCQELILDRQFANLISDCRFVKFMFFLGLQGLVELLGSLFHR
jgi:hypothetical protein